MKLSTNAKAIIIVLCFFVISFFYLKFVVRSESSFYFGRCSAPTVRTYQGQLPSDKIAIIETTKESCWPIQVQVTKVQKVDGEEINPGTCKIELLPGEHQLTCYVERGHWYVYLPFIVIDIREDTPQTLVFQAEAGHVYTVYARCDGGPRMWIADKQTGAVVAEIWDFCPGLLLAAGFHRGFPDTPKKWANLENMVQRQIVGHTWNGKVYYVYADAEFFDSVYVGNQAAYQRLQQLVAAEKIAKEQVMAAEMNEATAMDWDAWGSFPYHFRAHDFIEMGEYNQAIVYFNKSLEIDPEYAFKDYAWRGFAYMKKGEDDRALADYNKALEINPKHACALHNRGELYIKQGKFDEAIADCNQAIKRDPDHYNAYVVRGLAYVGQGQFEKALADYKKALELDPRPNIAYYYKGKALEKTGRSKEALTAYQKFLENALPMHAYQVGEAKERIQKLKMPRL